MIVKLPANSLVIDKAAVLDQIYRKIVTLTFWHGTATALLLLLIPTVIFRFSVMGCVVIAIGAIWYAIDLYQLRIMRRRRDKLLMGDLIGVINEMGLFEIEEWESPKPIEDEGEA